MRLLGCPYEHRYHKEEVKKIKSFLPLLYGFRTLWALHFSKRHNFPSMGSYAFLYTVRHGIMGSKFDTAHR